MESHRPEHSSPSPTESRFLAGWRRRGAPVHHVGAPVDPRFSLANERTFLAWNRTALALIGGGLAEAQLLRSSSHTLREVISLGLIILGAVISTIGLKRWRTNETAMRLRAPQSPSPLAPAFVALSVGGISVSLAVVIIVDQLRP